MGFTLVSCLMDACTLEISAYAALKMNVDTTKAILAFVTMSHKL